MKKLILVLIVLALAYFGIRYLNQFLSERTQAPVTEAEQHLPGTASLATELARRQVLRNFGRQVVQIAQRHHIQIIKRDTALNTRTGLFEATIKCQAANEADLNFFISAMPGGIVYETKEIRNLRITPDKKVQAEIFLRWKSVLLGR